MPEREDRSRQETLTIDSDLAELDRLREFVDGYCGRVAVPDDIRFHVAVALEELTINSIKHGHCDPRSGAIQITLGWDGARLAIAFSDNGAPFDPLSVPAPELKQEIASRSIGGLGVHLVRCLMPEIRYERRNGRNCLFLTKPVNTQADLTRPKGGADANHDGNCPC
jgi:serine/threonine-protein kinase RsbW